MPFQIYLAFYYCMTDFVLLFQYFYYRKNSKSYLELKTDDDVGMNERVIVTPKYGSTDTSKRFVVLLIIFGFKAKNNTSSLSFFTIGQLLAWMCTSFYLSSRIPQIIKNYKRHSVEGLSLALFSFAVCGNVTYALSIILRPGKGSIMNALPYIFSSIGTLLFDLVIFIQFLYYNHRNHYTLNELV